MAGLLQARLTILWSVGVWPPQVTDSPDGVLIGYESPTTLASELKLAHFLAAAIVSETFEFASA